MTMTMYHQAQPSLWQKPTGGRNSPLFRWRTQKEKVTVVMGATGTGKSRLSIDLAARYPAEIINSCKMQVYEGLNIATNKITDSSPLNRCRTQKDKVVVVMGATGTGKSRLSIDLAARYPAEIINSDKMQVYEGLNIATNKITDEETAGVPHHLLGIVDPEADFTAGNFVTAASLTMKSIVGRGKLPIIVGGSNSFIEALVDDQNHEFRSCYDVCFLWVDVAMHVLHGFVSDRVDRMVAAGMVEEVGKMYDPNSDYSKGIRRAIGVPEFDAYFRAKYSSSSDAKTRAKLLELAINETKMNTCKLAYRQLEKIRRLRNDKGWKIHRLDATPVFEKRGREANESWAEIVAGPGSAIVNQFLFNINHSRSFVAVADDGRRVTKRAVEMVVAAAL